MGTLPLIPQSSQMLDDPLSGANFLERYWRNVRNPNVGFVLSVPIQAQTAYVSISPEGILPAINALKLEVAGVRASLIQHQKLLEQILASIQGPADTQEIEIEDVDDAVAREQILALFKDSSMSLFYDDIADRLRLPLRQTVEICNQLETEGLIGEPRPRQ